MRLLILPLLLAACSGEPDQPGQVTVDEERQLNQAAEMLDANSVDLNALDPDAEDAVGNQEEAE
jgi:hypothetical protein